MLVAKGPLHRSNDILTLNIQNLPDCQKGMNFSNSLEGKSPPGKEMHIQNLR